MPNRITKVFFLVLLAIGATRGAGAQEILVLGGNGDLQTINPSTGQATYIGSTGFHTYFWSAFAQDSQGRLFGATGDDLVGFSIYEIDPQTGQGVFVVQTNLHWLVCMAFGPGDILYVGEDRFPALSGSPCDLYTLDLSTGASSFVGDTGVINMLAMDFNQGILYGYPYDLGLVTIDTNTGLATDVNSSFRGPNGSTVSMCFDDEGTLYYIDQLLWMMDADTGTASVIDWISPFGFWTEAVFVEGVAPKLSLWLAGQSTGLVEVKVAGATPGDRVAIAWADGSGGPTSIPSGFPCAGTMMDLNSNMRLAAVTIADSEGKASVGPQFIPASAVGRIRIQAVEIGSCRVSNKVIISY